MEYTGIKSMKKITLLFLIVVASYTAKAQTTYYWVHNQVASGNTYLNDMITISGTTYWKHISTVSGGTLAAQLTPTASLSFAGMGNDDIVFDNNSFTYTTTVGVSIYLIPTLPLKISIALLLQEAQVVLPI